MESTLQHQMFNKYYYLKFHILITITITDYFDQKMMSLQTTKKQ